MTMTFTWIAERLRIRAPGYDCLLDRSKQEADGSEICCSAPRLDLLRHLNFLLHVFGADW